MTVTLTDARATPRTRAVLRRLFPLYIHDLSPHTTFYRLDHRARWHPELWRDWLVNPHIDPWLLEVGGEVLGFAIVAHQPFPYMSPDRRHKLCEYFVLASHRRQGIGRQAALRVFNQHAGSWELTILPSNLPAIRFWRSVINGYTGSRYEEFQLPGDIVVRFDSVEGKESAHLRLQR
jgi:predicted acetyltransferase